MSDFSFVSRKILLALLIAPIAACSPQDSGFQTASETHDDQSDHTPDRDNAAERRLETKVIYGDDNRRDLYMEQDPAVRKVAESTVALITKARLSTSGSSINLNGSNYGKINHLCANEPFIEQDEVAFCSGFLVAPDIIVTAGHCIRTDRDCSDTAFVFGFSYQAANSAPKQVPASDVYSCQSIIRTETAGNGADFAVVKLNRPVLDREPLALRQAGSVQVGDDLTVIGHPSGIPLKIADGAKVRTSQAAGFFVANLDTYGGNSGSAVFNTRTLEVEGVLVRGEQDFEWTSKNCSISMHCKDDSCRGEDVTRITNVLPYLQSQPMTQASGN